MAFTMHSHSGQFCGHAVDGLEQVVQRAIALGFQTLGLTEHMPRVHTDDLYPEERGDGTDLDACVAALATKYDGYVREAVRLRDAYADRIEILVGFEGEWIRGAGDDGVRIAKLAAHPAVDYFVGSVHHVGRQGTAIDFDRAAYETAMAVANEGAADTTVTAGASPELALHCDYYDQQLDMLRTLRPRIVGHFDLVRLLSDDPARDPATDAAMAAAVWPRIERNLAFVAGYGGWLECNTSALRKGLAEPYPARAIATAWLRLGGRFTMSDDSHGTAQVATNYRRGLAYLRELGVTEVWTFTRSPASPGGDGTPSESVLVDKSVPLDVFEASLKLDA